jgi:hypothetical protein
MRTLAATFLAQIAILTVGAVSPFGGKVYLPSPRRYVAAWLLWFVLGIIAAFGPNAARLTGRFAGLVVLGTLLSKTIGRKAVAFLDTTASAFPAGAMAPSGNLFSPTGATG